MTKRGNNVFGKVQYIPTLLAPVSSVPPAINDTFLYALFARIALGDDKNIELQTRYDKDTNTLELDIPSDVLPIFDQSTGIVRGPNLQCFINWLIGLEASKGNALRQTAFTKVAVDTTTTSTTFVDLLTLPITIEADSSLIIKAAFATSNLDPLTHNFFRLLIDSTPDAGVKIAAGTVITNSGTLLTKISSLSAGSHMIKVQWKVLAGTGTIRPVSLPDSEYASLLLEEVNV